MSANPNLLGQVARQHHREMLAEARQHQLGRQARPAPRIPNVTSAITRRLAAAIAKVSVTTARVPDAS
jgi:hypothetical protein